MKRSYRPDLFTPVLKAFLAILLLVLAINLSLASNPNPVADLADFNVTIVEDDVLLEWTSSIKKGTFQIEIATDIDAEGDLVFELLEEIPAHGYRRYEFKDATANKEGLRYYRVKQIDGESETVSEVATANFMFKENFTLNFTSQTTLDGLLIGVNSRKGGLADITITALDADYKEVFASNIKKGFTELHVDLRDDLPKGDYLISFTLNGDTQYLITEKIEHKEFTAKQ